MSAQTATREPVTLSVLARQELKAHDGDTTATVEALTGRLLRDAALLRAIISAALLDAVNYRVEVAMRTQRASIMRASGRENVIALANGIERGLLDVPLANGVRLRDATRDQVIEQAQRYEVFAKDTGRKARWLWHIGQSVQPGEIVGRVLTEERVAELWREVA